MGKKRITILGSEDENKLKAKRAVQLEQKKLREGKDVDSSVDAPAFSEKADEVLTAIIPEEVATTTAPAAKSPSKTKIARNRSEAYKKAKLSVKVEQTYSLVDALELLKKISLTKFDPTVELHIVLKSGQLNQTLELPFSTGKTKTIAIATDETISQIESGNIKFDVLIASPAQMGKLVKFAKVLGPKGLMPNPKNGTVVADPESAAKKMAGSITVNLRTEKSAPVIHLSVGKLSQKEAELIKNIETVKSALPAGNVKKIVMKSTMSPGIKLTL
jgi:large subunit ribosomal protein L1